MTHSLALVQVGLRIGRWILPWIAVVFVSAALAAAIRGDQPRDVQVAASTGEATGPAAVERSTTSPERCAPIASGYMDSSIVAESRKIDCGWAP